MTQVEEDKELRELLEEKAETVETEDGEYLAVDIDVAIALIKERENKARIEELESLIRNNDIENPLGYTIQDRVNELTPKEKKDE